MNTRRIITKISFLAIAAFFVLTVNSSIKAQLLVEDFNYPAGDPITAHGWTAQSAGGTNPILVVNSNLTYSGYPSSGVGSNAAALGAAGGEDDNRTFTAQTSGSVYAAFLVNVSSASTATAGEYFFHLSSNPISPFVGRVFVKRDASNNLAFGISKGGTTAATISFSPFSYALNTTYLLIVRYTIVAGATNDTVDLFINPALGMGEPSPTLTAPVDGTVTDPTNIGSVALRQGGTASPALVVDAIRVGTTFSSVTNAPTAASATVGGRVTEANGRGIFRARVTLIDSQGIEQYAYTNTQGYYSFPNVPGGQTYIFSVRHLRYQFAEPTVVEFVDEDNPNINFSSAGESLRPANRLLDQ